MRALMPGWSTLPWVGFVHLHHHLGLPGVGVVEPLVAGATNRPLGCLPRQSGPPTLGPS